MIYVTDTHPLFWFLSNNPKLSKSALEIFEGAEKGEYTIIIPSIVLAELMYILEKKKSREKFKEILDRLEFARNYDVYPLDTEILGKAYEITNLKELHDRIVIATAKLLDCGVITKDEDITKSREVECIW